MFVFEVFIAIAFVVALLAVLVYSSIIFVLSLRLKRNDIADVAWGSHFVLIALIFSLMNPSPSIAYSLATVLVVIWGTRIVFHIGTRFFAKPLDETGEDARYAGWREHWTWFKTRSYFQVYVLQGVLATLVMLPLISRFALDVGFQEPVVTHWVLLLIGLVIWCLGFFYEVVGDWQLGQFIKSPSSYGKRKGDLMTEGVWAHTRHPNYFGEIAMWWGIWLILFPALPEFMPSYFVISIVGPLVITVLVVFVSGVRMTESNWRENKPKKLQAYAETTPVLFPRWVYFWKNFQTTDK